MSRFLTYLARERVEKHHRNRSTRGGRGCTWRLRGGTSQNTENNIFKPNKPEKPRTSVAMSFGLRDAMLSHLCTLSSFTGFSPRTRTPAESSRCDAGFTSLHAVCATSYKTADAQRYSASISKSHTFSVIDTHSFNVHRTLSRPPLVGYIHHSHISSTCYQEFNAEINNLSLIIFSRIWYRSKCFVGVGLCNSISLYSSIADRPKASLVNGLQQEMWPRTCAQ